MRIGMFADMYAPHVSGVTNYVRLYKRELEALGHDVWVLTYGERDYADDEANVVRSAGVPFGSTGWQVPMAVSIEARRVIDRLDVVHIHHPFVSGYVGVRSAKRRDIPAVFTNHTRYDVYSRTYAGWIPSAARDASVQRYLHWFAHEVDRVLAPSPEIAEWLADWGVTDDATVFRNVIDVQAFADPSSPKSRTDLRLSDGATVIAYLGRVAHEKNMHTLVRAFVTAASADSSLALLVIGDGPAMNDSRQAIADAGLADRAVFLGTVPYDEAPNVLAAADIFATASTSETWPLVVMEAAAAGLPTVGVRSPGVGELVRDMDTGMLVDDDADQFADALLLLARDRQTRERLARAARSDAPAHDIRPAAARMAELYESLIAARTDRR